MIEELQFLSLLACPACRFDPNSEVTVAANLAVAVMGTALAGVLGGFLCFIWKMAKAERQALAAGSGAQNGGRQAHLGETHTQVL